MFLKPQVTKESASRIGHGFAGDCSSEIRFSIYESPPDLASETETRISDLHPRDRIDTQSFIRVVE